MADPSLIVRIYDDTTAGTNRYTDISANTSGPQTDIAGSPTELWGLTLTRTNVIAPTFGTGLIGVGGTGLNDNVYSIDAVRVKVYYTEAAGGNDLVLVGLPAARGVARGASRGVL